ncbi:tetratricopeptide repeat-containing sensor histidine kinase [uncultured Draconibacterium sp.]|uniref:tetratricopeptide repeat-containing sensor histidine kinase n=1 Tax=uncultured Draconibacterium sp. TaxID=1573823 RepID=UPI00260D62C3|nr:tetratricopeptide repeat-containing sensor histidine kinase [uncultured Draconibacterium sp.]
MNKRIKLLISVIFTLSLSTLNTALVIGATTTQADSLRQVIQNKQGAEKINAQLDLAMYYMGEDNDQALALAQTALTAAKKRNSKSLQMRSFLALGRIYHDLNNADRSQAYYDSALPIAYQLDDYWYQSDIFLRTGINQHTSGDHLKALQSFNLSIQTGRQSKNYRAVGAAYSMMGTVFRVNGLYDRATEYIIKARLNYEKAGFTEGYAWSAYLLGRIYADLRLLDKAMEYYMLSLETYEELAQKDQNKNGIVICYEQIGILNLLLGNTDEARKYIENTLQIFEESGSRYGISNAYKNLGRIEYASGNYALAEKYLKQSLNSKIELNDFLSQPSLYLYIGLCYIDTDRTNEGLSSIQKGLDQAIINNQKRIQLDIYSKLSEIYLNLNDLDKALSCQQQQINIQDSMLFGAANIKLEQLQGIYELDAKNSQIAALEQQNEINRLELRQHRTSRILMIIAVLLAIIIAGIIYIFYQRLRQKNNQLEEANLTKDKFFAIIAHDLRGPVHTQTAFLDHLHQEFDALEKDELKKLLKLLVSASENISDLLDNLLLWAQSQVKKMEVNTEKLELKGVIQNTVEKLQQSASLKQIAISLDTDNQLKVLSDANMLQTIIRNIVSNAIKFTPRGGSISVKTFASAQKEVTIKITDTGLGMDSEKLNQLFDISSKSHSQGTENEKSNGLGLILVKDFVEKNNGSINIESEKGKGTSVIVTLPQA